MLERPSGNSDQVSLLCLHHTQQILPALAALLRFRSQHGQDLHARTVAFVWSNPNTAPEHFTRRRAAFEMLLKGFPWIELWTPDVRETSLNLAYRFRVAKKRRYFTTRLHGRNVTEIVYAHDLSVDFTPQAMMQAFPEASRICFGDALGVVYTNSYFESAFLPLGKPAEWLERPHKIILNLLKRLRRAWLLPSPSRRLVAQHAALILGCDPGGDFLPGKNALAVSYEMVAEILDQQLKGLEPWPAQDLMPPPTNGRPEALVLLGAYTESKLSSLDMEIDLYRRTIAQHLETGSRLLLKPHPCSSHDKLEYIVGALRADYEVAVMDESLYEVPIEAMPWACLNRRVLSYSYSSVSLVYLFNADVIHALTDEVINSCFFPEVREWVRSSNDLYLQQRTIAARLRSDKDVSMR